MSLRFAIRDDDVCFHTDPQELKWVYGQISLSCPISFSCIPFVGGFDVDGYDDKKWGLFDERWLSWQTREVFPIGENTALISLLKQWCLNKQASIMMHGINHDLYEFRQNRDFEQDVREAKLYLEKVFCRNIKAFSAPNNSLSARASKSLSRNNLDLLTAFAHLPHERPISFRNYLNFIKLLKLYIQFGKRYRLLNPLNFGGHKEQPCYTLGPSTTFEEIANGFDFAVKRGGNFVIATHYYHLSEQSELLRKLEDLIDIAKAQPKGAVEFVTVEELF